MHHSCVTDVCFGIYKDLAYKPPLIETFNELEECTDTALKFFDSIKLQNVRNEFDYRLNVYYASKGLLHRTILKKS